MKFRRFGKTDVNVRILGFGGAGIGFRDTSLCDVERLLGDALDSGLNVVTNQNGIIRGRSSMFLHTRLSQLVQTIAHHSVGKHLTTAEINQISNIIKQNSQQHMY